MLKILLLDCSESLQRKLKDQGFNVESGTSGFCTGTKNLPAQVYEKDVFIYDPTSCVEGSTSPEGIFLRDPSAFQDDTPEYSLDYLKDRIKTGATFVAFVNRLSNNIERQNAFYRWIPFMPRIEFTSDKLVWANPFSTYPDDKASFLVPIVTVDNLFYPVMLRLVPPPIQDYPRDVFFLFGNGHGHSLGMLLFRGSGMLIVLPRYKSNEDVADTFLHRVIPQIYRSQAHETLVDVFRSPAEGLAQREIDRLVGVEDQVRKSLESARVALNTANRTKLNIVNADETAKQIQIYYDHARKQDDAALYYLYKIIESIENKFGGEAAGIAAVGEQAAWKAVKRLANESYRDARHAPRPGDVIKKWSNQELDHCFENTRKVVLAYLSTLFKP